MNTLARPAETAATRAPDGAHGAHGANAAHADHAGNAPTPAGGTRPAASLQPPVDVFEDASGITLCADLPGVPRDKLHLRVEGDQLTLEAEIELAVTHGMASAHAEVTLPRYRRAFTLSKELDASQVSAELSQGVLRVRIPKAAHLQPRRIEVKVH